MEVTRDRYVDHGGMTHVDFSFWDENKHNLGHVLFLGDPTRSATRESWTAGIFLANDPRYEHSAKFDFTPGRPLNEIVSDRVKKTIGMRGWLLLEQAYRIAFLDGPTRANPSPRARRGAPVWRRFVTAGGHEKFEGAVAHGGASLFLHKFVRKSRRHRWEVRWLLTLGVRDGRVVRAPAMALHDVLIAQSLLREALADGDAGTAAR